MDFISEELLDYVTKNSHDEPEILKELTRETYQKVLLPRMLSGTLQGRFLSMLSKTHETTLSIAVNYKNYPTDLVEINSSIDFIEARVKAPGFSIVFYHFFNFKTLKLDYEIANSKPLKNGKKQ